MFLFMQTDEDEMVSAVRTWGSQHSALRAALAASSRWWSWAATQCVWTRPGESWTSGRRYLPSP